MRPTLDTSTSLEIGTALAAWVIRYQKLEHVHVKLWAGRSPEKGEEEMKGKGKEGKGRRGEGSRACCVRMR